MSDWSAPPPPAAPGGASERPPTVAETRAWRAAQAAQTRAWQSAQRQQLKQQRTWLRMQRRLNRRRSLLGPVLLLAFGVVLLLLQMGRLSWLAALSWYGQWWPAVLIAAGALLLGEWALDTFLQSRHGTSHGTARIRGAGGGVVWLLLLLGGLGWTIHQTGVWHSDWADPGRREDFLGNVLRQNVFGLGEVLGVHRSVDSDLTQALGTAKTLTITDPHGDVTVTGTSTDGEVHVTLHKQVTAWNNDGAEVRERQLEPGFRQNGDTLALAVASVPGGQADLTVEVPRGANLEIHTGHGATSVDEVHAAVQVQSDHGDVEISRITGPVSARLNNDDASMSAQTVTGDVTVQGRAGDINVSEIKGAVVLQGDFFGTTHAEHVTGALRFATSRTQLQVARIDGELDVEGGPDLQGSALLGPVLVTTRDRNITLDDVQGSVAITNRNGSVAVTTARPTAAVTITNRNGSVDLGMPGGGGFTLKATAENGDLENDFGLVPIVADRRHTLSGTVGGGGPMVQIDASEGDVTVRKSSAPPLTTAPAQEKPRVVLMRPEAPKAPPHPPTPPHTRGTSPAPPAAPPTPGASLASPTPHAATLQP